jgi:eukaryotic-like serine/threonine-protein kinase
MASPEITADVLAQRLLDCNLCDVRQVDSVFAELGTRDVSLPDFSKALLRKELVTNYQLERLIAGERSGYIFGDYKVLYLVGSGTFARVFRAVNMKTGKEFAVKVLRKRFRDDPAQAEQFLREGEIGARLRHPNIVPIYEVSKNVKELYMVMEFVEGQNLRAFVKARRKFSPKEAAGIGIDICSGLAYAAERGMGHRDLKLSNVLLTSRGKAKLVDFGLASVAESMRDGISDESINSRTIDYVALERASGTKKDDPGSDLFFTGTILYHMLTGHPALVETKDRIARLSVSRFQEIKPILDLDPKIPKSLAAVIMKSLDLKPEKRYARPLEMLNDLKAVLTRIEQGNADADIVVPTPSLEDLPPGVTPPLGDQEGIGKTVMVVESKVEMQDTLREQLKKRGYKVLIIGDADRAVGRFNEYEKPPADCVIFCTPELGDSALKAFNRFANSGVTRNIPAILFADQRQSEIIRTAYLCEHRVLLTMPMKVKELRETLLRLFTVAAHKASQAAAAAAAAQAAKL